MFCLLVPAIVSGGLYGYEQPRVRWSAHRPLGAMHPPDPALRWQLDAPSVRGGVHVFSGTLQDEREPGRWLQPTLLLVAPDGQAMEYRTNLRSRESLMLLSPAERQRSLAGFELRVHERHVPSGTPLRIVLAVAWDQGRTHIDTGVDVTRPSP